MAAKENQQEPKGLLERLRAKGKVYEYAEAIVLALLLALVIRTFIIQAFKIPSPSMVPTLLVGDHILVNKFLFGVKIPFIPEKVLALREPRRWDIVVFRYPNNRKMDFIKRCVAVEGETVEIRQKRIYVDGTAVEDPYGVFYDKDDGLANPPGRDDFGPVTVPPGKIFVMGDNRDNSNDSRFWGFVDLRDVKGKAMIIYWSWDRSRHWPRFGRMGDVVR